MSFIEGVVVIVFILCLATVILAFTQKRWSYQGEIIAHKDENGVHYTLEFGGDPYDIQNMKTVTFKVVKKEKSAD